MMTGLLSESQFSRRSFVKRGGALIVGFSLAGSALSGRARAAAPTSAGYLPDPNQVDSWLTVGADNTATLNTSQIETGNGIQTGFLMIAAEELDMDMSQMRYGPDDTYVVLATGGEGGSNAIAGTSGPIRAAAVTARQALLNLASTNLGVPVANLTVKSGVVSGGGKTVTYGALLGGKLFNVSMPASYNMALVGGFGPPTGLRPGQAPSKPIASYTLVGTSPARVDIPAKVTGTYTYVHNVRLNGMLHGRVVRPRGQGAWGAGAPIVSVDPTSIAHLPNVQIVQKGNFLGVVAPHEWDAIQAAAQLEVTWKDDPILPGSGNLFGAMRKEPANDAVQTSTGNANVGLASAATVLSHSYSYPYNGHLPIGPMCCVADVTPTGATIFSSTQDIESLASTVSSIIGMTPKQVRVKYYEGSGSYGSNTQEDVAESAALMSQSVGKPVRVQFMRWDEHGWDMYGPATRLTLSRGRRAREHRRLQLHRLADPLLHDPHPGRADRRPDAGSRGLHRLRLHRHHEHRWAVHDPKPAGHLKSGARAEQRVLQGDIPAGTKRAAGAVRVRADGRRARLRSEDGPGGVPQAEHRHGKRPAAGSPGGGAWIDVLNAVTKAANWVPKVAASNLGTTKVVTGRGVALGGFAASQVGVVADISVNKKSGKITVDHLYAAQVNGLTISPGLVENQMSGNLIQGLSRACSNRSRSARATSRASTGSPTQSSGSRTRRR